MLISKTVLHFLYGEFQIYDEFSDCCYGFPASRIYYPYCVGQRFLISALLPFWAGLFFAGGERVVLCIVGRLAAFLALPTRSIFPDFHSVVTTRFVFRQCHTSPRGQNHPLWRTLVIGHEKGLRYHSTGVWGDLAGEEQIKQQSWLPKSPQRKHKWNTNKMKNCYLLRDYYVPSTV